MKKWHTSGWPCWHAGAQCGISTLHPCKTLWLSRIRRKNRNFSRLVHKTAARSWSWMAEILHHRTDIWNPLYWDKLPVNWWLGFRNHPQYVCQSLPAKVQALSFTQSITHLASADGLWAPLCDELQASLIQLLGGLEHIFHILGTIILLTNIFQRG